MVRKSNLETRSRLACMAQPASPQRRQYEWQICARIKASQIIPFRNVSIGDWRPEIAKCHDNVARWIKSNPGHTAIHGWIVNASYGEDRVGVTAHTVVRDEDGSLFDITPVADERVRPGMAFVLHPGDDTSFYELRTGTGISYSCPPDILDNISLTGRSQNPFNDIEHW
jgi:hypothetical protein